MHIPYTFHIFHVDRDYVVTAGIETDTDGSGRPLISVELHEGDDMEELAGLIGERDLTDRIIDAYNELDYLDPRD